MSAARETLMFEAGELIFEQWRDAVDREFVRITTFEADDFPDWHYADAYADGVEPIEAAHRSLAGHVIGQELLRNGGIDLNDLEEF